MRLTIGLAALWLLFYALCALVVASGTGELAWSFWPHVADVFGG